MNVQCYKCYHEWDYKGRSKHYVCCPECYNKISLKKMAKLMNKDYILPTRKLHTREKAVRIEGQVPIILFPERLKPEMFGNLK